MQSLEQSVNGAIQCTAPGAGSSCTKSVTTGFVGGAAVGAAEAVGAGLGGAIVGGAAGGAVGGLGNYATNAFVSGSGVSWGGAWDATWKGAAGAIGGGAGSVAGNYMAQGYAQMVGGFAGGASGSALNGGSGWQVLQGGLMGAGMSFVNTLVKAGMGDLGGLEVNEDCKHNCTSDRDFLKGGDYESKGWTRVEDIDGDYTVAFDRAESGSDVLKRIVDNHLAELANHPSDIEVLGLYDLKGNPLKWSFVEGGTHSATFAKLDFVSRIRFAFTNTANLYVMHNHPTTALGSKADFEMSVNYKAAYMIHTSGDAVYKNSVYHEYKSPNVGLYKQAYIKW